MANAGFVLKKVIPYDEKRIEEVLKDFSEKISEITLIPDIMFRLNFAAQELIVNALEHGYKKSKGEITISINKTESAIFFEINDFGAGIDLPKLNIPDGYESLEDMSTRGWGLSILNKLFNSLIISNNKPQGTKVSLILELEEAKQMKYKL